MGIVFCRLNRAVRALQPADAPRLLSQNRNQGHIEKTTAAAGQKLFFHLCPGSGAVPVIEIPKEKREQILLLAEGSHVLWVVGFRISEYYKIEEHTENILQVTCDGGKDYGR